MKMTRVLVPVMAPLALAISDVAAAGDAGFVPPPPPPQQQFIVRVGGTYITPRTDQVSFVDETFQFFDAFRTTMDPDNEWGWYINGEWKPFDHFGIELSYVDGDDHGDSGNADGYFSLFLPDVIDGDVVGYDIGKFEASISTASLKWYPLDPSCLVQPYVGGGISYTDFDSTDFSRRTNDILFDEGLRGNFDMGYSWGYTWQAGVDFNFGHDSAWLVNVAAVYARAVTDMRLQLYEDFDTVTDGPLLESYSGDYIYDPWMFNLSVGYKFSF